MTDRELMQRALDALDSDNPDIQIRAALALRDRLAQPEPEPVAWRFQSAVGGWAYGKEPPIGSKYAKYAMEPLYTAPVHASDISAERVDETAKRKHEWVGLDGDIPSLGLVTEEFYNGMLCAEDILRKRNTRREWVGLAAGEAKMFYDSNLNRAELIDKIDEFLEEKNGG